MDYVTPEICDIKHDQLMKAIAENTHETRAIAKLLRGNGVAGLVERTSLVEQRITRIETAIERTTHRVWSLVVKVLPYIISLGAIGTAVAAIQSSQLPVQPDPYPAQHSTQ